MGFSRQEYWSGMPLPSQVVLVVKNPPAKAGNIRDIGSIPGSGRSSGGGHGILIQMLLACPAQASGSEFTFDFFIN